MLNAGGLLAFPFWTLVALAHSLRLHQRRALSAPWSVGGHPLERYQPMARRILRTARPQGSSSQSALAALPLNGQWRPWRAGLEEGPYPRLRAHVRPRAGRRGRTPRRGAVRPRRWRSSRRANRSQRPRPGGAEAFEVRGQETRRHLRAPDVWSRPTHPQAVHERGPPSHLLPAGRARRLRAVALVGAGHHDVNSRELRGGSNESPEALDGTEPRRVRTSNASRTRRATAGRPLARAAGASDRSARRWNERDLCAGNTCVPELGRLDLRRRDHRRGASQHRSAEGAVECAFEAEAAEPVPEHARRFQTGTRARRASNAASVPTGSRNARMWTTSAPRTSCRSGEVRRGTGVAWKRVSSPRGVTPSSSLSRASEPSLCAPGSQDGREVAGLACGAAELPPE